MATKNKVSVANKIYTDFDYKASVDFIKNQVGDRKTILDTNCRNGTLLSLLQKEGFTVSGLAKSKKFKKVIEEQVDCPIKNKSILKYKSKEKYQVITSLFSACNRFKNYLGIDRALGRMNKALTDDGIIILQLLKTVKPQESLKQEELETNKVIRQKKDKIKVVNIYKLENKTYKFKSKFKIFDVEKIANIAKKNGLRVVDVFRNYNVKIPDEYGDNVQIVLAKNTEETTLEAKRRKKQFVTKKGKVKTLTKKAYITTMILMACSGVFLGTLIGDYYNSNFANAANFDYSAEQIATSFAKDQTSLDAIDTSKKPSQYGATYVMMYAEREAYNKNLSINEYGSLTVMGVNQKVANKTIVTPTVRTKISASISSLVSLATKVIYTTDGVNESVSLEKGTPTDLSQEEFGVNWGTPAIKTVEEYQSEWGVIPAWITPYIVCSDTVYEQSGWTEKDGLYTAKLSLKTRTNTLSTDPTRLMAYTYYVKQINAMSGVTVTNVEFCDITFTVNSNFEFVKIEINEQYNVRYGVIPVTCPSVLTQDYTYN